MSKRILDIGELGDLGALPFRPPPAPVARSRALSTAPRVAPQVVTFHQVQAQQPAPAAVTFHQAQAQQPAQQPAPAIVVGSSGPAPGQVDTGAPAGIVNAIPTTSPGFPLVVTNDPVDLAPAAAPVAAAATPNVQIDPPVVPLSLTSPVVLVVGGIAVVGIGLLLWRKFG